MHLADDFLQHPTGLFLISAFGTGDHLAELLLGHLRDNRAHRGRAEHVLGLPLELGFGDAYGDDRDQTGENIVTFDTGFGILEVDFQLARIVFDTFADLLGDALQEAVDMHAAARCLDDVDEAAQGGVIPVDPAQGDIDLAGAFDILRVQFAFAVNRLCFLGVRVFAGDAPDIADRFALGQEVDEILDTAGVEEFLNPAVRPCGGRDSGLADGLRVGIIAGIVVCTIRCGVQWNLSVSTQIVGIRSTIVSRHINTCRRVGCGRSIRGINFHHRVD